MKGKFLKRIDIDISTFLILAALTRRNHHTSAEVIKTWTNTAAHHNWRTIWAAPTALCNTSQNIMIISSHCRYLDIFTDPRTHGIKSDKYPQKNSQIYTGRHLPWILDIWCHWWHDEHFEHWAVIEIMCLNYLATYAILLNAFDSDYPTALHTLCHWNIVQGSPNNAYSTFLVNPS